MEEIIPVGPITIRLRDPVQRASRTVRWRVSGRSARVTPRDGWLQLTLPLVREHELGIVE
jgi:hypothetical protein